MKAPAARPMRRLTGKPGEQGVFTFVWHHTPDGDTYRSVYVGAERARCAGCDSTSCDHVREAQTLVAGERAAIAARAASS